MKRVFKRARSSWKKLQEAYKGVIAAYRVEHGFRKIVISSLLLTIFTLSLPLQIEKKIVLILSLLIPVMAELINSAIERAVDTATDRFNKNAREAKDISSSVVYLSIFLTIVIWVVTIFLF